MANGAYRVLRELGLRVPDDVSLLAFDDYPWLQLVEPGIDTLAQPVAAMGHAAAVERIQRDGEVPVEPLRFPAELKVRGIVRPPA